MIQKNFKEKLQGKYITLRKFRKEDIPKIKNIAALDEIWTFNKPINQPIDEFISDYINKQNEAIGNNTQISYVVVENSSQEIIGSTRFYDISFLDKKIAIGFTWYHPSKWGTKVNPETKLLLLEFAFEELKFNRVEFHIDSRNKRSINAVKKLGAKSEGILRNHKIVQNNFVRDTVLCSIIPYEWPKIKKSLLNRIAK